jgi:hypothetical protein
MKGAPWYFPPGMLDSKFHFYKRMHKTCALSFSVVCSPRAQCTKSARMLYYWRFNLYCYPAIAITEAGGGGGGGGGVCSTFPSTEYLAIINCTAYTVQRL